MSKKNQADQNRLRILSLLEGKSALKQDIAKDTAETFEALKVSIKAELEALRAVVKDPRIRLHYKERGKFEIHAYIGSDVLVFSAHQNVFRMPDHNPLWGTGYFQSDEKRGYFGIIYVYNFLAESLIQNRMHDEGYLIARILINTEKHLMVEGRTQLSQIFRDPERHEWSESVAQLISQMTFAHALSFDLYVPPYDLQSEISVVEMNVMGESLNVQTSKRLGFKMKADEDIS